MKKMDASEIIDFILNDLDVKAPTFAANINVSYTRIHDIQKGRTRKISGEVANRIISNYPQYNFSWLISGEGEIYNGTLSERLDKYLSYKNINVNDFLATIKMESFRYTLLMPSNIRKDELDTIYLNYPDLNPDWLLEGKGEMLKKSRNSVVSEPMVSYGEKESESVSAISIIDRNSRSIEKMVEIADRNSRSIQQLVDSNMKLIELLHQNGIIVSDETRKGGFYDSNEDKEGQSRNTRTTQAG